MNYLELNCGEVLAGALVALSTVAFVTIIFERLAQ